MVQYNINDEQLAEIIAARKNNKNKNTEKRLKALEMRANGCNYKEIADKTDFHKSYISQLVVKYFSEGIQAIIGKERQGNCRNMSLEEEIEFLEQFREKAENGQVVTAKEIKISYEEKIGHKCGSSQIYRLLKRHNWRKVKPRGKHSKQATEEEAEAPKKLTFVWMN